MKEVTEVLFPVASELVFTAPQPPATAPWNPKHSSNSRGEGHTEPTIAAAVAHVFKLLTADDVVVITGSLYLVGEARALFLTTTLRRW